METRVFKFHKRADDGRLFSAGQVVRIVRAAKENPAAWFGQSFGSSWHGGAADVLRQWADYCQNEINRRGGLTIREVSESRILKLMQRHIKSECNWCGSLLNRYEPKHRRFCEDSCRRAYFT